MQKQLEEDLSDALPKRAAKLNKQLSCEQISLAHKQNMKAAIIKQLKEHFQRRSGRRDAKLRPVSLFSLPSDVEPIVKVRFGCVLAG